MSRYRYDRPLDRPLMIVVQGQARGGKGSLSRALRDAFSKELRVSLIEQGLKFRIFAYMALERGIDYEDMEVLRQFVLDSGNQQEAVKLLDGATNLSSENFQAQYYNQNISNVSGMFGKISETHDVVIDVLREQVKQMKGDYDLVIIDGRALKKYAEQFEGEGLVKLVLTVDVICEPLTAARRVTGIFAPVEELSNEELIKLIHTTEDISLRNSSDARRKRDPSVFLHEAFELDVLRPVESEEQFHKMCEKIYDVGVLSIDNSYTRTLEQLTAPSVGMIGCVVERFLKGRN